MQIAGKVFIVTGGASGLGEATARMLIDRSASVLIADVNPAGEAFAAELGANALFVRTDVTSEEDGHRVIASTLEKFGAIHGLINCAGIAPSEKIVGRNGAHSLENFTRTIMINLVGTFNMLRLAAEAMMTNEPIADGERGVIINTASIAAFEGQIGQAAYAASKARKERHSSLNHRAGPFHDADDGGLPRSGAGIARAVRAIPATTR
jgi:NAD(P)-dependent dehydrogenase (short-subunit alcohol dehydrogenase family)